MRCLTQTGFIAAATLLMFFNACGGGNGGDSAKIGVIFTAPTTGGGTPTGAPTNNDASKMYITEEQAIEIVLAYVPDGKAISSESTKENGIETYYIEAANNELDYSFIVNAAAGEIKGVLTGYNLRAVKSSSDVVDLHDFISDDEARDIALYLTGGGDVTLCRLSYVHGDAEYEVGIANDDMTYQIFIDAYSGVINRFTRDSTPIIAPPASTDNPIYPDNPASTDDSQINVMIETAKKTALSKAGGGTVARVETKYHPHGIEFHVLIVNGDYRYCVHVNAGTGYVTDVHTDLITTIEPNAYGYTSAVGANNAKSLAIQAAGGIGIVTECKLEYKKHLGALTYHIHVANGQYEYCVELNAATGSVLKVEPRYKP